MWLSDPGAFESLTDFPARTIWWRRSNETRAKRRNPLFDIVGVSVWTLVVDILHCLFLGVARDYCASVLWWFVQREIFIQGRPREETLALTVLQIRRVLWEWYPQETRRRPDETLTRLEDLVPSMLGPERKPEMSTKGAETKWFVYFCVFLLRRYEDNLDRVGKMLLRCGVALMNIIDIYRDSPARLPPLKFQQSCDNLVNMLRYWEEAGIAFKPKTHLFVHLVLRAKWSGNPNHHSTFEGESINKTLGTLGRMSHRMVWELRVFAYFDKSQEDCASKRRRL